MPEPLGGSFSHVDHEPMLHLPCDLAEDISFLQDKFGSEVANKTYNLLKSHIANTHIALQRENSKLFRGIGEIFNKTLCSEGQREGDVAEKIDSRADPDITGRHISSLKNNSKAPDSMDVESDVAVMSQQQESIQTHKAMVHGHQREKDITTSERCSELKKKIEEMTETLRDKDDELQAMESLSGNLIIKEQEMNDKLSKAKDELTKGLRQMAGVQSCIGVKQMGQLDPDVFLNACILKGVKGDLELEASLLCSECQKLMIRQAAGWHPFKVMNIGGDIKGRGTPFKQDGSNSREAKNLLSTPSPCSLDRPARARKTVERLVEVIEKEPGGSFIVEKGRGTPLKNIPGVAKRISNKKHAELKFLHQILFGRLGKADDFKSHILEFSGFLWHESDEKRRAKTKEKLDRCSIETLLDLCNLLVVPVSKDDIVAKLLDFIAEPHADSTLSDDQGSNSRKHKREVGSATKNPEGTYKRSRKKFDDEHTSCKRLQKHSESESDEDAEEWNKQDDHMKSDSEENKDAGEDIDCKQEDRYGRRKVKAGKKSVDGKGYTTKTKRKRITWSVPNTAPAATLSKCLSRVSSLPKISEDIQSTAVDPNVVSRKSKPITLKRTTNSDKETNERRSSGKGSIKGESTEAEQALPSKDELQKTIVQILKKVDFENVRFCDLFKMLGKRYKMDLSSMKGTVKSMVQDELLKLAEADED